MDDDNNIFDEDDALDYILYDEYSEEPKKTNNGSGCLSGLVIIAVPFAGGLCWLGKYLINTLII